MAKRSTLTPDPEDGPEFIALVEAKRIAALQPLIELLIEITRGLKHGQIVIHINEGKPQRLLRTDSIYIV